MALKGRQVAALVKRKMMGGMGRRGMGGDNPLRPIPDNTGRLSRTSEPDIAGISGNEPMVPRMPEAEAMPRMTSRVRNDLPDRPRMGARDGLGSGAGGLAVHPSMSGANMGGYEPIHTSRKR